MQVGAATLPSSFPNVGIVTQTPVSRAIPSATRLTFSRGEELFAEGEEADFFYEVVSGAVRTYKLLNDGRRQIDAFHLRGDIFGLEGGTEHHFYAEAVDDAVVIAFRRTNLRTLMQNDAEFRDHVMSATLRNLERAQTHMVLLGRKTAQEKIATFLLDMARRLPVQAGQLELPMQRSDIADHLGLTIETVSRTLTQLARSGFIKLSAASRSISLCNKAALQQLNA